MRQRLSGDVVDDTDMTLANSSVPFFVGCLAALVLVPIKVPEYCYADGSNGFTPPAIIYSKTEFWYLSIYLHVSVPMVRGTGDLTGPIK